MFHAAADGLLLLLGIIWVVPVGILLGLLVGATPGIGSGTVLAIMLPLLMSMRAEVGLVLGVSIYVGAEMGGVFPATLINIPGTHSSAISCLDGYPMALGGEASRALGINIMGSTLGALTGGLVSLCAAPLLAKLVLWFSPVEVSILVLFGIAMIAQLSAGGLLKGVMSGFLGLFLATIGTDPLYGQFRGTFGIPNLIDGLAVVPVLIGILGFSQLLNLVDKGVTNAVQQQMNVGLNGILTGLRDVLARPVQWLRGSIIGSLVGMIPGAGGTVVAAFSYQQAFSAAAPERKKVFGHGAIEGILAVDTAHNSMVGGGLIPLLTLGIPGSSSMAVLLIVMGYHGLAVGPTLFAQHGAIVYAILWSQFVGAICLFVLGTALAYFARYLASVPDGLLIPTIGAFCLIGSFAQNNQIFDMGVMLAFGVLGHFMYKHGYSPIAFILGFILGPTFESSLFQGLDMGYGSPAIFFTRPIAIALWVILVLSLAGPWLYGALRARLGRAGGGPVR